MELSTTKGFAFFRHLVRQRTIYLLSNSQAAGVVTSSERLTWKCIRYEGGREGGFATRSIEEDLRLVSLSLFFFQLLFPHARFTSALCASACLDEMLLSSLTCQKKKSASFFFFLLFFFFFRCFSFLFYLFTFVYFQCHAFDMLL